MGEIQIVRSAEESGMQNGRLVAMVRVTFMIGGDGPFSLSFPKDGFNGAASRQAIEAYARELDALHR